MKQFIVAALVVLGLVVASVHQVGAAEQYVNDADINLIDAATSAINAFDEEGQKESFSIEAVKAKSEAASQKLSALEKHSFTTELGTEYSKAGADLQAKAKTLREAMTAFVATMEGSDEAAYNAALDAYTAAEDTFGASYDALNAAVEAQNTVVEKDTNQKQAMYLAALILTGLAAAASWAWAILKKEADAVLQGAQKAVAINSLWPLGGAIITFVTFQTAKDGSGSYTIMWGLIVFGLIAFGKSIMEYVAARKLTGAKKAAS